MKTIIGGSVGLHGSISSADGRLQQLTELFGTMVRWPARGLSRLKLLRIAETNHVRPMHGSVAPSWWQSLARSGWRKRNTRNLAFWETTSPTACPAIHPSNWRILHRDPSFAHTSRGLGQGGRSHSPKLPLAREACLNSGDCWTLKRTWANSVLGPTAGAWGV